MDSFRDKTLKSMEQILVSLARIEPVIFYLWCGRNSDGLPERLKVLKGSVEVISKKVGAEEKTKKLSEER